MTDRFNDINAMGGLGRSPITTAGRVATNGHLDEAEILKRKERLTKGTSLYGGTQLDEVFWANPREICLQLRTTNKRRRNLHKAQAAYILTTLNGAFKKGDKLSEVIEKLEFQGVAGGQGAKYDHTNTSPEIDLALQRGGLTTMRNTGRKRIKNGDPVYWTLPDPDDPYDKGQRNSGRMPVQTAPYDPYLDSLTEASLRELLIKSSDGTGMDNQIDPRFPLMEGAKNVKQVVSQLYVNAIHTFLMSGIVKLDIDALNDEDLRSRNSVDYKNNLEYRQNFLEWVSFQFNLRDVNVISDKGPIKIKPYSQHPQKERTLSEYAMEVFLARNKDAFLLPLEKGTNGVPPGNRGAIIRNQRGLLSDFFAAVNRANEFTKRRIIGKAITPADPGKPFDIYLGNGYSS